MGDSISEPDEGNQTSFKDIFFREDSTREKAHEKDDVKLQDGEVITKTIDGILPTCFSERVHSLVEKSRCLTEIVNLMGRRVQVNALLSKDKEYYIKALIVVPWIAYGHFARIAVVVDLEKPLILKIWIDGMLQQVEYKCLPKFDTCPIRYGNSDAHESNNKEVSLTLVVDQRVELKNFDDWMIVVAHQLAKFALGINELLFWVNEVPWKVMPIVLDTWNYLA
ncbi:hypothetical protein GOBAR_DD29313 [Gossypium barbadense]|nr:hypothetical protein GOBAR_DD29313 [Gossypium barbadense]